MSLCPVCCWLNTMKIILRVILWDVYILSNVVSNINDVVCLLRGCWCWLWNWIWYHYRHYYAIVWYFCSVVTCYIHSVYSHWVWSQPTTPSRQSPRWLCAVCVLMKWLSTDRARFDVLPTTRPMSCFMTCPVCLFQHTISTFNYRSSDLKHPLICFHWAVWGEWKRNYVRTCDIIPPRI